MKEMQKKQIERLAEGHRRTLQILEDEKAMEGIYEAMVEAAKGERGVRLDDIERRRRVCEEVLLSPARRALRESSSSDRGRFEEIIRALCSDPSLDHRSKKRLMCRQ